MLLPLWAAAWSGAASGRAAAQAHELDLRWSAPPECPDRRAVVVRMARHWPAGVRPDPGARAEARISRERRSYRLDLQLWTPSPSADRTLTGSECTALAEAAALLIALTFESDLGPSPGSVAPEVSVAPQPERADPPPGAVETDAPARDGPAPASGAQPAREPPESSRRASAAASTPVRERTSVSREQGPAGPEPRVDDQLDTSEPAPLALPLSAALRFDSGMLPQTPAIGLQARLGVQLARLRVALGMTYWLPAQTQSVRYPTARLTGRGVVLDLTVGVELVAQPLRIMPLLAVELGQLGVSARRIALPADRDVLWLAGGGGLEGMFEPVPNLELGLELLGIAPWPPPRWLVRTPTGDVAVFRSAPLTLHVSVRIAYVFR